MHIKCVYIYIYIYIYCIYSTYILYRFIYQLMVHCIGRDGPATNPQMMHCFKWQLCVRFAVFLFVQNFRNITRHKTRPPFMWYA